MKNYEYEELLRKRRKVKKMKKGLNKRMTLRSREE